jgi:Rap1a immunity proteins
MDWGRVKASAWAAAAVAAAAASPAQAIGGKQLLQQCEALERGALVAGETVQLPKSQEAAACWFYMGAVQDLAATVEEEGGPSLIGSCVPAETTRLELVRAFTKYARAHRADLDLRATALIIPALSNAFPCPLPGRTEAGPPKAG